MSDALPDETSRTRAQLTTPLGLPGSGRLRYAAAMSLHRQGRLSPEALEVYRICSPRDAEDPVRLLVARGLAQEAPSPAEPSAIAALSALVEEIDRYLAQTKGPGIGEVRAGIAAARGTAIHPQATTPSALIAAHLPAALGPLAQTHPALALAIAQAAPNLDWVTYDDYPLDEIGPAFAGGHAYAPIIGTAAPVSATDFDLGLFLIAPPVLYRDRSHKAPELYVPLTGPHGWRFGPGAPLLIRPAHQPVWNEPFAPHLTKVGPVPFLALYGWTRDVAEVARVIPADDWPELEALRIVG